MPRNFFTPEARARLLKAARENPDLSHRHLAERFGVSRNVVHNALFAAGIRRDGIGWSDTSGSSRGDLKRALAKFKTQHQPGESEDGNR